MAYLPCGRPTPREEGEGAPNGDYSIWEGKFSISNLRVISCKRNYEIFIVFHTFTLLILLVRSKVCGTVYVLPRMGSCDDH